VEQKIIPRNDPTTKFTSGELMALVKGRLHPVAELGGGANFAKLLPLCSKLCGMGKRCLTISRRSSNGSRSCPTGSTSGRSL
jgi:hypothetical protein